MKRIVEVLLFSIVLLATQFAAAETIAPGKQGSELRDFLRTRYRPSGVQSYKQARTKMFSQLDNRGGKVRCVYTGVEIRTTGIPNGNVMNTEHTWPQGKFNKRSPMVADLHHLFPTLNQPNNHRGSNPFAEIPDTTTTEWFRAQQPQRNRPPSSTIHEFSENDGTRFEPREDQKGNTARAMFYMWVVYGNDGIQPAFIQPQLTTLAQWHRNDPADSTEITRNNGIRAFQGNDNPFVLDATLVDRLLGGSGPPVARQLADVTGAATLEAAAEAATSPVTIRVVGWNLQSDFTPNQKESNPKHIQRQMAAKNGVNIWGLSEVLDANALKKFEAGAEDGEGTDFISVMGKTGGRDRLAVIYDSQLFEQVGAPIELTAETQLTDGLRASLAVQLKGKRTGKEFLVLVNHLKRGEAQNPIRLQQSKNLNAWARTQRLPIIALGDWNYDYDVEQGDAGVPNRDGGFDALIQDNVFQWVRPTKLVKSQADDDFNTLLDFVFVANAPFGWTGVSRILERDGDTAAVTNDFSDDKQNTDHRPVDAVFTMGSPVVPGAATRAEILERIRVLEEELDSLRNRLDDLEE